MLAQHAGRPVRCGGLPHGYDSPMPAGSESSGISDQLVDQVLSVVRLGDLDHYGWWRSHGLDETGSFILQRSFKRTWAASAMELSMASARVRHDEALQRSDAVHLFSDELPVYRVVQAWLLEQKLEDDMTAFEPFRTSTTDRLLDVLPSRTEGEHRGGGLWVGSVSRSNLADDEQVKSVVTDLLAGYRTSVDGEFVAPYVDLVA